MSDNDFASAAISAINNGDLRKLFEKATETLSAAKDGDPVRQAMAVAFALAQSDAKNQPPPPAAIEFLKQMAMAPVAPEGFRTVREQLGISQTELGKFCGVTHGAVSEWERGVEPMPAKALIALMQAVSSKLNKPENLEAVFSGGDLRQLRKALRMRQKDLAATFGVSVTTIEKWEREPSRPLSALTLARIRPQLDELRARAAAA